MSTLFSSIVVENANIYSFVTPELPHPLDLIDIQPVKGYYVRWLHCFIYKGGASMDGWQKNDRFFPMDGDESYLEDAPALNARISVAEHFQRLEQASQPAEKPFVQPRVGQPYGQSPLRNPLTPPKPLMPGMLYGQPSPAYSQPTAEFYPPEPSPFGGAAGAPPMPEPVPPMAPPAGFANPYAPEPAAFQPAPVPIWSLSNNAEAPQSPFTAPLSKPAPLTAPLADLQLPDFPAQPADEDNEPPAEEAAALQPAKAEPAYDNPLQIPTYLRRKPMEPSKATDEAVSTEEPSETGDTAFDYHDPYKRPVSAAPEVPSEEEEDAAPAQSDAPAAPVPAADDDSPEATKSEAKRS